MSGEEPWPVGDENAGVADRELLSDTKNSQSKQNKTLFTDSNGILIRICRYLHKHFQYSSAPRRSIILKSIFPRWRIALEAEAKKPLFYRAFVRLERNHISASHTAIDKIELTVTIRRNEKINKKKAPEMWRERRRER